ncbi:type II toxin-antitoxin system RelE/ParE family toxin [Bacteroidota bacterium]
MKIIQSRLFERKVKKLTKKQKKILDKQVQQIIKNISIGEEKRGDLKGVRVLKFKIGIIQYLLSYRVSGDTLEMIMLGPHENYYRDLKKYLRS